MQPVSDGSLFYSLIVLAYHQQSTCGLYKVRQDILAAIINPRSQWLYTAQVYLSLTQMFLLDGEDFPRISQ